MTNLWLRWVGILAFFAMPGGHSSSTQTAYDGTTMSPAVHEGTILLTLSDGPSALAASTSVPPTESSRDDVEVQIDILLGLASAEEIQEYYTAQSLEHERRISACMQESGFEYEPRPLYVPRPLVSDVSTARQYGFGVFAIMGAETNAGIAEQMADPNAAYMDTLEPAARSAFWQVQEQCYLVTPLPAGEQWRESAVLLRIMDDFNLEVETDSRMAVARREWVDCMAAAGYGYTNPQELYDDWQSQDRLDMVNKFQESEAWLEGSPDHGEWSALAEEEVAVAVAAANCDGPVESTRLEVVRELRSDLVDEWLAADWASLGSQAPS